MCARVIIVSHGLDEPPDNLEKYQFRYVPSGIYVDFYHFTYLEKILTECYLIIVINHKI